MNSSNHASQNSQARQATVRRASLRNSVFAKLLLTMFLMAVSIVALVIAFFWFTVGPNLHSSVAPVLENYAKDLATSSLDFASAKKLRDQLNLETRYEGPGGDWTTAEDLPKVADIRQGRVPLRNAVMLHRNYIIAPAPNGGNYLFAWSLGQRMTDAHDIVLVLLVTEIIAVLVAGYVLLKRFLNPLRTLNGGVAALAEGRLDVKIEVRSQDEFGRLTAAFNEMAARVRGMIAARDQLLADVSHELRSPLTRLRVALELLPEKTHRKGMEADIAEMELKVSELLELERLRSGRGLELARQDLVAVVREASADYERRGPGIILSTPTASVLLDIDSAKVRSVVRNLLENAFKYAAPKSPVEIVVKETKDEAILVISDDGPGIAEKEPGRLFEPFYRADPSRAKKTGGYGLGLSICKRIMQAHGGDIVLDRSRERGASFVITFPKKSGPR